MRSFRPCRNSIFCRVVTGVLAFGFAANIFANPTGMTVGHGSASVQQNGSQLTVTASQNAFLNWQSFNIAAGETTTFKQPSASSIVWNRINDQNPSQIYGNLNANGVVVLLNSSGFYFGPHSFVSAAGLVVSTANCAPPNNSGGSWEFNGPPPLASIVNYGRISVGQNGSAFLIADQIENHGTIEAPGGTIGLAAGQTVLLSERPDGRGMSLQVTLPQGSVDNCGNLIADAGTIALNAKVMNQDGLIQANSVREQNGVIELVADEQLNLGANSQILASGDNSSPGSSGGTVTLKSGNNFSDAAGSQISVAGGSQGGNGGAVEISAPNVLSLNSQMDARAQPGWMAGKLSLDPDFIILDTSGPDSAGSGTVLAGDNAGGTLDLNVNSAFANFSQIILQAAYDITFADGTGWNLSASTGQSSGQLILEAGRNIIFGNSTSLSDGNNWSVSLYAGVSGFSLATPTVMPGAGSIYLNANDPNNPNNFVFDPSGSIQTASGSTTLVAGQDITVGSGSVITTGGGSIFAHALAGSIDTGSDAQGYYFSQYPVASIGQAYNLSHGLGGISTAAGGDVTLIAGGDVTSVLPDNNGYIYDGNFISSSTDGTAGSGAYGNQANEMGNVTIVAGGNVTGHYLVANGTGSIYCGVEMDANGDPVRDASGNYVLGASGSAGTDPLNPNLALSLISGGWNVNAAQNIILQEVRNPNGIFDVNADSSYDHYFDYAPDDYVNLSAGNMVQLGAASSVLARLYDIDGIRVPIVYPSILNIAAGAGGVDLDGDSVFNQLILFPSPEGSLNINTTQGGSLTGNLAAIHGIPQIFNLIVSDSGQNQYLQSGTFGLNDHAVTPIHLNNPTPIDLNISGDMNLMLLGVPEAAQITVGGDMNNCRFQGMNLSADPDQTVQVPIREIDGSIGTATVYPGLTSISVTGDIINRSAFTSVDLSQVPGAQPPDLSYLSQAQSSSPSGPTLATSFYYNPTTHLLTYQNIPGQSLASVLTLLQNLTIQVYQNGVPQWADPPFDTMPVTTKVSVLNAADAEALLNQYNALGTIPSGAAGYTIGGGGKFNISAHDIDLGTTAGIQSKGVGFYKLSSGYPLASLFDQGADISVTTTGDLDMYSSSIASLNGGNISINAGGDINVGSSDFSVTALGARGIYSTSLGDVGVYASGNINVNGSRIAAYDGGNVTVESFNGDVDAGSGGLGFVVLSAFYVDPLTRKVYTDSPTIPGSGILATTFPKRDASYPAPVAALGNILVETPDGNVTARRGGIVELPLNGVNDPNSIVDVLAGYELRDSHGNPVSAANLADGSPVFVSAGRNLDASGSGIIGNTINLNASGNILGVVFARDNLNITAQQNVSVTALSEGTANVSAGDTISGTIIGVGGITASGGSVDASLLSNGAISGSTSGQSGLAQGTAANNTSAAASNEANQTAATATTSGDGSDDETKKKKPISLAQKAGRVTVILPTKTN